jgi:exopolyphosphatase/guanosine-5'-triphosphate,3'-diphosphate pyrophosphatase
LRLVADGRRLVLNLPKRWLDARPLLRADLAGEPEPLASLGIDLIIEAD